MIHVISTGLPGPHVDGCRRSVEEQGVTCDHHWMVAIGDNPRAHFDYLSEVIAGLHPLDIVVSVDLDDVLLPGALATIAKAHLAGAWMTWGSFRFSDGRPGFAAPLAGEPRFAPWSMTHLKSYRAGLVQRIRRDDLMVGGEWLPHARDLAVMIPCAEMAGPDRRKFLPEILYEYHLETSGEWTGGAAFLAAERRCVEYVRSRPRYGRIEAL